MGRTWGATTEGGLTPDSPAEAAMMAAAGNPWPEAARPATGKGCGDHGQAARDDFRAYRQRGVRARERDLRPHDLARAARQGQRIDGALPVQGQDRPRG